MSNQAGSSGSQGGNAGVEDATLHHEKERGSLRPKKPVNTPKLKSPLSKQTTRRKKTSGSSAVDGSPAKSRRSRGHRDELNMLNDSGSDDDVADEADDDKPDVIDFAALRREARRLRDRIVADDGSMLSNECVRNDDANTEVKVDYDDDESMMNVSVESDRVVEERVDGERVDGESLDEERVDENVRTERSTRVTFSWSDDFNSFSGQQETYTRVPGPSFSSHDPTEIFCRIWDRGFLELVVKETNQYAVEVISELSNPDLGAGIPNYLEAWTELTVEELYRYLAVLIRASSCYRSNIREYWSSAHDMGMPDFRKLMGRNRFLLISKFLHFTSNENLLTSGYQRKVEKVAPVVAHCNERFRELYTPSQHLSLDESLLLWKGRLSWKQCIRSKAARFGIKSFELCEADTGYLLQYSLYTGKGIDQYPDSSHGFQNHTAKIVLNLMEGYLDVGHVLVMDNWYNQLALTRYLKSRRTDVLGTLNRRGNGVPSDIKDLMANDVKRGATVSRHCGDIALVTWQDVKLVTVMSTYHTPEMVPARRAGQATLKPKAVQEYNKYMGGVDLKDQKLSMFLLERKRNQKWYIKVFKRLFNTSLLNAYIIYCKNPMYGKYSHREFRQRVADGIFSRYPRVSSVPPRAPSTPQMLRLQPGQHFPVRTGQATEGTKAKHKQLRCVRCTARNRRVGVTQMCDLCKVPLCLGQCWKDYHNLVKL